jgi:hypothetical protein
LDNSVATHWKHLDGNDEYEFNWVSVHDAEQCGYLHHIAPSAVKNSGFQN